MANGFYILYAKGQFFAKTKDLEKARRWRDAMNKSFPNDFYIMYKGEMVK